MRRLEVVLTVSALADLEAIESWLFDEGAPIPILEAYMDRLRRGCLALGDAPGKGWPRDDLAPGLRVAHFESSVLIAYRVAGDQVEIVSLFRRGRDYDAILTASSS